MKRPSYAILRVLPLKSWSAVSAMSRHGRRIGDDMEHVTRTRSVLNRYGSEWNEDGGDIRACMEAVMDHHQARPRKSAPIGSHLILTASPAYFRPLRPDAIGTWDPHRLETWLAANIAWVNARWPRQVAAWRLDLDESTPHLDVFLVPVHEWKTKSGRIVTQVSHRSAFGTSRQSFGLLQNEYADVMKPLGLERGRPRSVTAAVHVNPAAYRRSMAIQGEQRLAMNVGIAGLLRGDVRDLACSENGLSATFSKRVPMGARPRFLKLMSPAAQELIYFERRLVRLVGRWAKEALLEIVAEAEADRQAVAGCLAEANSLFEDLSRQGILIPSGVGPQLRELARMIVR